MTKNKFSKERRTLLYGLSTSWFKTSAGWEQAKLAYGLDESTSALCSPSLLMCPAPLCPERHLLPQSQHGRSLPKHQARSLRPTAVLQ